MQRKDAVALGCVGTVVLWSYWSTFLALAHRWSNEPDYSHGFLVPVFAGYLLWVRRDQMPAVFQPRLWVGGTLILLSAGLRWLAAYLGMSLADGYTLLPCLLGVALMLAGLPGARWALPSIAFLGFMIPLPGVLAGQLSHPLQRVATVCSTFVLQLVGIPAISQGNVILLTAGEIGVVEACSGLRMLMVFGAITIGAAIVMKRPLWEKLLIAASAVPIGIIANVFRITLTGLAYEWGSPELAETLFHDLAGWLMMPFALVLLMLELQYLARLLVVPEQVGPAIVLTPVRNSSPAG